jgi:UDP:flavonoid glycosyltransferase YjiC (YdhE family)
MATIGLLPCPGQVGHFNCNFALARRLQHASAAVVFYGFPSDRALVEAQGFEMRLLSERDLPDFPDFESRCEPFRLLADLERFYGAMAAHLDTLNVNALLGHGVSRFVCDGRFGLAGHLLRITRLPHVVLNTTLPSLMGRSPVDPHWPPMQTTWFPARSWLGRLRIELAWWYQREMRWKAPYAYPILRRNNVLAARLFRDLERRFGVTRPPAPPAAAVVREFTACPRAFEFSSEHTASMTYAEPLVDLERRVDAPVGELPPGSGPLVLMVFGTNNQLANRGGQAMLERLVQAARIMPQVRFLLSIPESIRLRSALPPNLRRAAFIAQPRLLQQAAVLVTHGGLNTIKEAILCEVPMLVIPGKWDAPGNAARVEFHGIGLLGSRRARVRTLREQLTRLLETPPFRDNIGQMRRAFERSNQDAPLVNALLTCPDSK